MTEATLRALFEHEVEPLLRAHAAQVEKLGVFGLYPIGVFLLGVLALVACVIFGWVWPALVCVAVLVPTVAVLKVRVPVYQAGGAAFRTLFKQRVVARIVAHVLPDASYEPDLAVARGVIAASGIVPAGGSYLGDDLVRGTIGRTPFALGDVRSSAGGRHPGAPFRGLFFHAEFNRSLRGRTLVVPEGSAPVASERNRGLAPATLENPAFEALFAVHASDPVEARYVLTPAMMERLVALRRLFDRPVHAAFDRGRVFIAIDRGAGSFDALAFGGERAWEEIRGYAALVDAARALVEELELDTRIWTKGFAPEAERQAAAASEPSAWTQVAAKGAWAFQSGGSVPFRLDDGAAPTAGARVTRGRDGGLVTRYPGGWGPLLVLVATVAGAAAIGLGPSWWSAVPLFRDSGVADVVQILRFQAVPAGLLAAAVVLTALYCARQRVRWIEASGGRVRTGALCRGPRAFPAPRIVRVFAAEDLVMAQVEGSWIPELLSPRLGSHGAARLLAADVERAVQAAAGAPRW